MTDTIHEWWGQLRHDGVLVTPQLLDEFFPDLTEIRQREYDKLRDAWLAFASRATESEARRTFVGSLLGEFCGLIGWQKGPQVADHFKASSRTGQPLRPDWVLTDRSGDYGILAVLFDQADRLGIGRGKRAYARLVELLRATGIPLGILTNGRQVRLVHAGPDYAAWAEWDAATWFDQAEGREQLIGLRTLLSHESLIDAGDDRGLVAAIRASRHRQGDLAQVLGEQVRQAVEHVIDALDAALVRDPDRLDRVHKDPRSGQDIGDQAVMSAVYQASTRLVMRLVVLLYAEARELLPRANETYHTSYGVDGLYQQLSAAVSHAGGIGALADRTTAWPRLLALFRIIHEGSPHQELPIRDYGGTLFRRGDLDADDAVLRALAILEEKGTDDATVLRVLRLLKIGRVKVRKGRSTTWVSGPVDFSDLRTEYIGIIYEGLLDFQLKRAPEADPIVFLNVGRQPALPLSRLEAMTDKEVKSLVTELRKDKAASAPAAESEEETASEDDDEEETEDTVEDDEDLIDESDAEAADEVSDEQLRQQAREWAERAVQAAGIVRKRGRKTSSEHAREIAAAATKLIDKVVPPGRLYLATWGGLRKGTGTFYTRPALAVPTTQRTLEPFCYDRTDNGLVPKAPGEILDLKVCDPSMGSGSFLVAALRYLTEALANSLIAHEYISARGDQAVVSLPYGREATGSPYEELLPVPPDDDRFDELVRARLARHVVERCIYGVDINPMAVELARLALWVETLDRELPFEFLDHKLKVGNSLVGCWLHLALDYPVKAWERKGGDGDRGEQTRWLSDTLKQRVKPELTELLERRLSVRDTLPGLGKVEADPLDSVLDLRATLQAIHDLPSREEREATYREFLSSNEYRNTKALMDRWCAAWFWPSDEEGREPALTPSEWALPSPAASAGIDRLADEHRFFHWEIEFADIFRPGLPGFDAIIGNPPWDIAKPNSREFFSSHDPLYRTYGKQEALRRQNELFEQDTGTLADWTNYQTQFKAMSNWVKYSEDPFDFRVARGKDGEKIASRWSDDRKERSALAHRTHPYRHQGSADLNTYKMFLEVVHHLLREGGRLGFVVPSGIWTDKGATNLRHLFLDQAQWEWCYGFENRRKIFPIDSRYKFAPIVIQRGGKTRAVNTAFMRHDVGEWEQPDPPAIAFHVSDVRRFSPKTLSFLELKDRRDLEIAEKIYADHPLLGEVVDNLGGDYNREFDMTTDSKVFVPLDKLARAGIIDPDHDDTRDPRVRARLKVAGYVPLYEGKSIYIHNPYHLGKGVRASITKFIRVEDTVDHPKVGQWQEPRLAFRDVARSTDQRTIIAALIPPSVHGNQLPTIDGFGNVAGGIVALLGSLVLDYTARMKISAHLNWFYAETLPVPAAALDTSRAGLAVDLTSRLNMLGAEFEKETEPPIVVGRDRLTARLVLDAFAADLYGLDHSDIDHIATRFRSYDKGAGRFSYPALAVEVYGAFREGGPESAFTTAEKLSLARSSNGYDFGLDEIYVPEGGWERANAEARQILEAG